jgi:hypothetical protein
MHGHRAFLAPVAILAAAAAVAARAEAVETGQLVPEVTLRQFDGGAAPLVDRTAGATAVVFFKTDQERSLETLKIMARCQPQLAGKPVRWVGVVPGDTPAAAARGAVEASGMKVPVLVDDSDALYAKLGIRMHPGIAIVDRGRRLVAYEPFHEVDYCGIVVARIRRVLGEISDAEVAKALAPATSQLPGGDDRSGVATRHVSFGRKLLAAKAYAQAHENARKAMAIAPSPAAWTLEGQIFAAEGKCAEALKAFESALVLDPKDAAAAQGKQGCGR